MLTIDTTISQVLKSNPDAAKILMRYGMHCLSCPCATAESLKDACAAHGTDVEALVNELNRTAAK